MERNSKSNSSKDHKLGSKAIKESNNNNQSTSYKLKDSLNCNSQCSGEDYLGGFSWPPRSYTCSFCKREFASAQALGGHMNVHRRDRARLMMSPPRDGQYSYLNLNFNPNPNFSTPTLVSPSFTGMLPPLVFSPLSSLSSPSLATPSEMKKRDTFGTITDPLNPEDTDVSKKKSAEYFSRVQQPDGFSEEDGFDLSKKAGVVTLDLEIGLMSDPKEDLDLELRLGYS